MKADGLDAQRMTLSRSPLLRLFLNVAFSRAFAGDRRGNILSREKKRIVSRDIELRLFCSVEES